MRFMSHTQTKKRNSKHESKTKGVFDMSLWFMKGIHFYLVIAMRMG